MPGRDGTGPLGNRFVYGRGMGYCNMVNPAVIAGCGLGLGLGLGMGMGFRGGRQQAAAVLPNEKINQKELLEEQKQLLETKLKFLCSQLENMEDEG